MTATCLEVRRALEEGGASGALAAHVAACATCREHATLLASLAAVAPGEADKAAVQAILAARPVASWQRRRPRSWLPLAAGLALMTVGLVVLGGVPGSSALAFLPGALSALVALAGAAITDTVTVLRGSAEVVQALVGSGGIWVAVWLLAMALGGGWGVLALARRRVGEREG